MYVAKERGHRLAKDDAHRAFHAAVVGLAGNRQLQPHARASGSSCSCRWP